jgi:hypothetical protein
METFKDDRREGDVIAIVLGGKVVVVDIDFAFDRENPLKPIIKVLNVKTSYAIASNGSSHNDPRSISLDTCLAESIQNFCIEVQRDENVRSPLEAARLGKNVLEQLKYLVVLDALAQSGGIKWFVDIHELGHVLEEFARSEAKSVASYVLSTFYNVTFNHGDHLLDLSPLLKHHLTFSSFDHIRYLCHTPFLRRFRF